MGCRITKGVTEQCTARLRLTEVYKNNKLSVNDSNIKIIQCNGQGVSLVVSCFTIN